MVPRKLPSELEEEILIRVPLLSLGRFRAVCKEWNTLFNAKRFANNHFACARPEFLLKTESNIYSISVNLSEDPTIKVSDLSLDVPIYLNSNCDGYILLKDDCNVTVVCNPWLRQTKRVHAVIERFFLCGIGYNSSKPEKSYKIFRYIYCKKKLQQFHPRFAMFEFETNAWKFIDHVHNLVKSTREDSFHGNNVSLNGNVYWIAYNHDTSQYFIRILDFSKEIIKPFCILPCKKKDSSHPHALAVYKGDRFSLLEQRDLTSKIEIWVTKKSISNADDGDAVVWIKFMTVSIPKFPRFISSSYLVDNNIFGKTFVMCCRSEGGKAAVYIVRGDLCKKIEIAPRFSWSSVYVPSLIPLNYFR